MIDPEFAELVRAGIRGDASLRDEQIQRFYCYGVSILRIFEEQFRQKREGTIADDRWRSSEETLIGIMRAPGYRATCALLRGSLDPEFEKVLDARLGSSHEAVVLDLPSSWRQAVAQSHSKGGEAA
jgi:hypothetical protein